MQIRVIKNNIHCIDTKLVSRLNLAFEDMNKREIKSSVLELLRELDYQLFVEGIENDIKTLSQAFKSLDEELYSEDWNNAVESFYAFLEHYRILLQETNIVVID